MSTTHCKEITWRCNVQGTSPLTFVSSHLNNGREFTFLVQIEIRVHDCCRETGQLLFHVLNASSTAKV